MFTKNFQYGKKYCTKLYSFYTKYYNSVLVNNFFKSFIDNS